MINNPLSQDEGVKFVFIPIATSFAHKHMFIILVISYHKSRVISYQLFFFTPTYYLKPHGNFLIYIYTVLEEVYDPYLWNATNKEKSQGGL